VVEAPLVYAMQLIAELRAQRDRQFVTLNADRDRRNTAEADSKAAREHQAAAVRERDEAIAKVPSAIAAGPFFSKERASEHMEARRHEYGKAAITYCFSGYRSKHYIDLRRALGSREYDAALLDKAAV